MEPFIELARSNLAGERLGGELSCHFGGRPLVEVLLGPGLGDGPACGRVQHPMLLRRRSEPDRDVDEVADDLVVVRDHLESRVSRSLVAERREVDRCSRCGCLERKQVDIHPMVPRRVDDDAPYARGMAVVDAKQRHPPFGLG
jgi:hypothetical protein